MLSKSDLISIKEIVDSSLKPLKRNISELHERVTILKGDLNSLQSNYKDIAKKLEITNLQLNLRKFQRI
jgi:hypothetical protein